MSNPLNRQQRREYARLEASLPAEDADLPHVAKIVDGHVVAILTVKNDGGDFGRDAVQAAGFMQILAAAAQRDGVALLTPSDQAAYEEARGCLERIGANWPSFPLEYISVTDLRRNSPPAES